MYIYTKEAYQLALDLHDWDFLRHLKLAAKHPEQETLHICRYKAGQNQIIAIYHAQRYFDADGAIFNKALAAHQALISEITNHSNHQPKETT